MVKDRDLYKTQEITLLRRIKAAFALSNDFQEIFSLKTHFNEYKEMLKNYGRNDEEVNSILNSRLKF